MSAEQTGTATAAPVFAVQEPTEKESRMPMEIRMQVRMQVRMEQRIDPRAVLFLGVLGAVLLYTKVEAASGDPPECS